ncbi:hypothetical protein ACFZ8E_24770 [Methylobacterium sp. HMF5984]|uniref:hypothetical protein n=1 Tax=Methylobacterium sp. HMF5984 TaxID=3367370 RepID=UPI0038529124
MAAVAVVTQSGICVTSSYGILPQQYRNATYGHTRRFKFIARHRTMTHVGRCGICEEDKELLLSHIIPRFMIKWIRQKRRIRFRMSLWAENLSVHERQKRRLKNISQDGPKHHLLCKDCESRLGQLENKFSRLALNNLPPAIEHNLIYDAWLYKFCCSIALRAFLFTAVDGADLSRWNDALKTWRTHLMEKAADCHSYETHLIPLNLGEFRGRIPDNLPSDWQAMLYRDFSITLGDAGEVPICVVRVKHLIFVGYGRAVPFPGEWTVHQIHPEKGEVAAGDVHIPEQIFHLVRSGWRFNA